MKDSKLFTTTKICIGGKLTTVNFDIVHSSDTLPGYLHGKPVTPGFHIEVSIPNKAVSLFDLEKAQARDLYHDTRQHQPCFIINETFEPEGIKSFSGSLIRLGKWIALNSETPKEDSFSPQTQQASNTN